MRLFFPLFLAGAAFFQAQAQIFDDFSDGNLTDNPAWQGNTDHFIVNANFQLQLDAPAAGSSQLYLPTEIADSAVWEIYFRMDFDPSNSNRLRIYLQSDSENLLTGSGYYLLAGEDGANDAIKFYRQTNGAATLLATATLGGVASSPTVRVRMTREVGGLWTLWADYSGLFNYNQEFSVTDATYGNGNYFFGLYCIYTATRRNLFFFDDIKVAPLLPDTEPPVLVSAEVVSATEVDVFFNEPLDELTATDPAHYNINNGIGEPVAAFLDAIDNRIVHLVLGNPLVSMTDYLLTTEGVADQSGNASGPQQASFYFLEIAQAEEFDILINEIMADPTPQVALPDMEFIELYNRSNKVIDLAGFGFSSGGTPQIFPSYLMFPGTYVLVCAASRVDSLILYGPVVGLPSFPALVNGGDDLTLTGPSGRVIHFVEYDISWYRDAQKADGGWTLEMINPLAPCTDADNWKASVNLLGGTPGQPNSVLNAVPDEQRPKLLRVFASPATPDELLLFFDKRMDTQNAEDPASYALTPAVGIAAATLLLPEGKSVRLKLANPLQQNVAYEVRVLSSATDCIGNPIGATDRLALALPVPIEPLDLVINEILFNPETGGVDFLEIYNRSDKILNLGDLLIANLREGRDSVVRQVKNARLIFPGEYAVFTPNPADILARYVVENRDALIANDIPAFNNDAGNVTIYRAGPTEGIVIDVFDYREDFHQPLLKSVKGVSLERLNPNLPTQGRANWHSAASQAGFATPTYRNSQFFGGTAPTEEFFSLPETVFSPDGDGYKDFLVIQYEMDKPGYAAKVSIFDSEGRPVKLLANNTQLAREGFFRWDGDQDGGGKARIGAYVVWIEAFHPDGEVRHFKKTCVLAGRL